MVDAGILVLAAVLAQARVDAPARATRTPRAPGEVEVAGYRLVPEAAGGYVWKGTGFRGHVARDGAVRFEDDFKLPGPAMAPLVAVAEAVTPMTPPRTASGAPGLLMGEPADRGGGVSGFLGRAATNLLTRPKLTVSDEDLRRETHHAAKMDFLTATAKFRADLRAAADRSAAGGALAELRRRVASIARDLSRPAAERRRLIFELWDECDDSPNGQTARAAIAQEAAHHFPANTRDAFTAAELARFHPAGFAPYSPVRPAPNR